MPYIFEGPVVSDWSFADGARNPGEHRYWSYFGLQPRGRSLLKVDGTWTVVDLPSSTEIDAADTIVDINGERRPGYLEGGHVHTVSDAVAADLTSDGFEAYLSEL